MRKGLLIYIFIIGILAMDTNFSYAGTDLISNALTQSNSFLKDAGLVQQKYSGILRKAVTTKVGINTEALNTKKIEKYEKKAKNLQEKAEKLQKRIETAKRRKKELTDKYNKLNKKASKFASKAQALKEKGENIQENYKTYATKVSEGMEKVNELKEEVDNKMSSTGIQANNENTSIPETEETTQAVMADEVLSSDEVASSQDSSTEKDNDLAQFEDAEFVGEIERAVIEDISDDNNQDSQQENFGVQQINQSDIIRSASSFANTSSLSGVQIDTNTTLININNILPEISATDIIKAANDNQENKSIISATDIKSDMSIQEQLSQSVNSTGIKVENLQSSDQLINYQPSSTSTLRSTFEQVPEQSLLNNTKMLTDTIKEEINVQSK